MRGRAELAVTPFMDFTTYFYSGGVFASALTSAIVKIFVEEFDPSGNFVRGIDGAELIILRENPAWFSGSSSWAPFGHDRVITTPKDRRIFVLLDFFYRVWVDLHGEIQAAGFGGIGGSGSIGQV